MSAGIPANGFLSRELQINGTWGLHADLVWGDYTGKGVVVTDLDDGFQINHPDFAANYNPGLSYDTVNNSSDGAAAQSAGDNHGTAVMGEIIGNGAGGKGSLGVAYGATAFGTRMGFGAYDGLNEIQEGFQIALSHGAAVMNNSWGYTNPFDDDFGTVDGFSYMRGIESAMQSYVSHGRGGLGGIIVFAAGNDRQNGDNTNYHNMHNSPYVITVAAIDSSGNIAGFSTPGTSILVSADGVDDITSDRTGTDGYANGDYIYFNGTSAATPLVSGAVALMLQANPNLGWRDVQTILAYSAQYNDPSSSTWQYNGAANWNGGGLHYSSDFGFGAANAFAAVRLAETWTLQQAPQDSANMLTLNGGSASPHIAITSDVSASAITVSQNINIEHVEVNLNISDTDLTGLTVTLIGPDGTKSVLVNGPANGTDTSSLQFQTMTVADWGETSAGQWTLQVQDTATGATGALNSWGLTFLGSAISNNHTYIYTNDFAAFTGAALAARSVISDNGGGIDTLNLAAITSNSTVNLTTGTGIIAGHAVTISAGTNVNNVYGGDGNDTITGNTGNDYLYGGRGNDDLIVMGGNDTINGGAGTDTVVYSEAVTDFNFIFTGAMQLTITDTVGTLGMDTVSNVEDFAFAGTIYTLQQLEGAVTAGGRVIVPQIVEKISLSLAGHIISSTLTGTQAYAGVEIDRDTSGLTLYYLSVTAPKTVVITAGNSSESITLEGTPGILADTITVGSGNDTINVNVLATTVIRAGIGNDTINGSSGGNNTITAGNGSDVITVGDGIGRITVGNGNNVITAGNGNDVIYAGSGSNTITAGTGTDIIAVGNGNNIITAGNGNDVIHAGGGSNTITVGAGTDTITVGNGNNTIYAGSGREVITAGFGNNTIYTGTGTETITVGAGANSFLLGGGHYTLTVGAGANHFTFTAAGTGAIINHFSAAAGDVIDISQVIAYTDPTTQAISGFAQVTTVGRNSVISIDADGSGSHYTAIATIAYVPHLDLATMISNGSLIV